MLGRGKRIADVELALDQPAAEQVAGAALVADRHIAGAAGRGREREKRTAPPASDRARSFRCRKRRCPPRALPPPSGGDILLSHIK